MDTSTPSRASPRVFDDRPFLETEAALERAGRVEELVRLYEGRAREVTATEAAYLLGRAGELAQERLRNPARAEEFFRRALLVAPEPRAALLGLKALMEARQDAAGLAEVLERLGAVSTGAEAAGH